MKRADKERLERLCVELNVSFQVAELFYDRGYDTGFDAGYKAGADDEKDCGKMPTLDADGVQQTL